LLLFCLVDADHRFFSQLFAACAAPHRTAPRHTTTHRFHTMRFTGPTRAGKTFTKFGTDEQFRVMVQTICNLFALMGRATLTRKTPCQ
jgi:hypothetical protein